MPYLRQGDKRVEVCNIRGGNFSRSEAYLLRLAGTYDITADNLLVESINGAVFYSHAGDLGFEFAPASIKILRHKGSLIRNATVINANNGWGLFADCNADNIARANNTVAFSSSTGTFVVGETVTGGTSGVTGKITEFAGGEPVVAYRTGNFVVGETVSGGSSGATGVFASLVYPSPLLAPIQRANLVIENCETFSDAGASVSAGYHIRQIIGVTLRNCFATGHKQGYLLEEGADEVTIDGCVASGCREDGFLSGNSNDKPMSILIRRFRAYSNGAATGNWCAIRIANSTNVTVRDCYLGGSAETVSYGLRADASVTGLSAEGNYVDAVKSGGVAYSIGQNGDYGILSAWQNNTCNPSISIKWGGTEIVTERTLLTTNGSQLRECIAQRASLSGDTTPIGGAWLPGERIRYTVVTAGGNEGSICITAGLPGIWKKFGTVAA